MYFIIYDTTHLWQNYSVEECETEEEAFRKLDEAKRLHGWDGWVTKKVERTTKDSTPTQTQKESVENMADNRMWLIHKPSRLGVMLGKRMDWGWNSAPDTEHLERFYQYIKDNAQGSQDDFVLAMEDCKESSCFNDWQYTETFIDGFRLFELSD